MGKLYLQLFGTVQIETDNKRIAEEEFHSTKLIQLLAYMALNRDRDVPRDELIDLLFKNDDPAKTSSSLRNLVSRLRSVLKTLKTRDVILTVFGGYCWNPDVVIATDVEHFEAWAMKVLRTEDKDELWIEQEKYKMSRKKFLADKLQRLEWFRKKDDAYQKLQESVKQHFDIVYDENDDNTEKNTLINDYSRSMQSVIAEISETEPPRGAYCCDYDTFRGIFRLEVRGTERSRYNEEKTTFMLIFTQEYCGPEDRYNRFIFKENMKHLGQAMTQYLKYDDVLSQCSPSQYVVILHNNTKKEAELIRSQILKKTNNYLRHTMHALECEMQDLKNCRQAIM